MNDLALEDFWNAPTERAAADKLLCQDMDKAITHTWPVKLYRVSDYKPPCSRVNVVQVVAVPQKKQAFEFVVHKNSYRVLHLLGWDYSCNADGIVLERISRNVFSACDDDSMVYTFPRSCPFTILPPGIYRISLFPVPVSMVNDIADGASFDVSVILEAVDQQFVDAITAGNV